MKVLFRMMFCALLAILSLTVCLWPTPGAGAKRSFLVFSKGEREPATPIEASVDNNYNNNMNNENNHYNSDEKKASRDYDLQPMTTTQATMTATTEKTPMATTQMTSANRMRQQRLSRQHRSLVFTNFFAWIKKIICFIFGQKFGFCSPPTPLPTPMPTPSPIPMPTPMPTPKCRTGPTRFTTRQQLNTALNEFINSGYTTNLQQYGANMNEWDVSAITDFSFLFFQRTTFNEDISCWNVGAGTIFFGMFFEATDFNQDIGEWDVSAGTNFAIMFASATIFNQDIGNWNVGAGTAFESMFEGATTFNQDIGMWNVGAGTVFSFMFDGAGAFNQNLCAWGGKMQNTDLVDDMFSGATMCANQADPSFAGATPGPFCANCN
jgi:hypothetical protein